MKGILGKKIGMSQVYNGKGEVTPVTMIKAGPCSVLEVMPGALKLGFDDVKEKSV
jgi:large subunit ribosomal protein L3